MGGGSADAGSDAGLDEFDAWRAIQQVLRNSPDAVPARADRLVAQRDVRGLFELVRDDIALVPTTNVDFSEASTAVRWGPRATLRGRAGTPRERAELLKDLYLRAGFAAEVMTGTPVAGSTLSALFGHGPQDTKRYDAPPEQWAEWGALLPPPPGSRSRTFAPVDPDGGIRARVLAQLQPLLPEPPAAAPLDLTLSEVPLVKVTLDGGDVFANPNLDGAQLGESRTQQAPVVAPAAGGERSLRVTLSAQRSARPGDTFVLADATWPASQVASRKVTVAFTGPLSGAQAARTAAGQLNAFIPLLLVTGDGLDAAQARALSKVGTPVLRDGTRVQQTDGGGLLVDGEPLAPAPTPSAVLSSVATLDVNVSAAAYPDIELLVSARTDAGVQVPHLASDAWELRENGAPVFATLRRTRASPPRVVLLFDRSTSIPPEFLAGAATVGRDVATTLFTQFPNAEVQVAAMDINGPTLAGNMVGTLPEVEAQLALLSGTGSEVWTNLDALSESGATCVVLISDAVPDDTLSPEAAARLTRGPPVIVAGVGTVDATVAARIASVTHGEVLQNVTDTTLARAVASVLRARQAADYRMVYRAPTTGPSTRQLTVSLRAPGTASGAATWTVPAAPVAPSALSALFLTVEADGRAVTRLLAGGPRATAADVEQVEGALFGRYTLSVEGGAPSLSTLLDEHLAERLALEPGFDAARSGDALAAAAASKRSSLRVHPTLAFATAGLPGAGNGDSLTFVDGLTVTLHATVPRLGRSIVRRLDLLPLAPRETVSVSGNQGFVTTLQRTSALAAYEAAFAKNTVPALQGKTLARFDAPGSEALGPGWVGFAEPTYRDYHVLAPADGSALAFWAVHRRTGEVMGVLPEGGAAEEESTEALVNRLLTILDLAGRAGAAVGYEGVEAWAELESTKVELLGGVIMLFEGESSLNQLERTMCEQGLEALAGPIPFWDELNMGSDDLTSVYRVGGLLFQREMPEVDSISSRACRALLGGP